MIVSEFDIVSRSTPFGHRLQLTAEDEPYEGVRARVVALLDARQVEELRDVCERFLAGERVP